MDNKGRIFATADIGREALDRLSRLGYEVEVYADTEPPPKPFLIEKVRTGIVALITTLRDAVDDEVLSAGRGALKVVAQMAVGIDNIDREAANRYLIPFTNTPDVLTEEVADTTLGLLLATLREFYDAEKWLRDGRWPGEGDYRLTASLRDRSVGIAGFGRIGKAIARRIEAFGIPVSYFGRNPQAGVANRYYSDLVTMARDIDTLILGGTPSQETDAERDERLMHEEMMQ